MGLVELQQAMALVGRGIFSTREIAAASGASASAIIQTLDRLERAGLVSKIKRGLWRDMRADVSAFDVVPHLLPHKTLYVSFTSALHLHGVIEQIPQVITVATLTHSRVITTTLGTYRLYQLCDELFDGFDWYQGRGNFLIASPTKALVDCLYLSGRKGKAFASFPELDLAMIEPREALQWTERIPSEQLRKKVRVELNALFS